MNPTVFTQRVRPNALLRPYIRYFAVRTFETGDILFPKTIISDSENVFCFFIRGTCIGVKTADSGEMVLTNNNDSAECYFTGIQTCSKGDIIFKGSTTLLNIHFAPTGIYHIFNISPKEVLEAFGRLEVVLGYEVRELFEQLQQQKETSDLINVLERYLCARLARQKPRYRHPAITPAAELLLQRKGLYPIRQLAYDLNMTIQTLETQFEEQVGIDPKLLCCLLRYNHAVTAKLYNPTRTWAAIAYTCGYYDQAHLTKEIKKFTGLAPKDFMNLIQPPVETFI